MESQKSGIIETKISGYPARWTHKEELKAQQQYFNSSKKNDFKDHKLRWDLLPLTDLEEVVKLYTFGAEKYGDNNWQNLENGYQRYKAAMLRHLLEYEKGNTVDGESGCSHLAAVIWNAIAMYHSSKSNK